MRENDEDTITIVDSRLAAQAASLAATPASDLAHWVVITRGAQTLAFEMDKASNASLAVPVGQATRFNRPDARSFALATVGGDDYSGAAMLLGDACAVARKCLEIRLEDPPRNSVPKSCGEIAPDGNSPR